MTKELLRAAFVALDRLIPERLTLLVGGGAAMVAEYDHPEGTKDVDTVPIESKLGVEDLKPYFLQVAEELGLEKDWLNPYFQTYTPVLPDDFRNRLKEMYRGKRLICKALGAEDLLVMKLAAGRKKDDPHIRRLFQWKGIDLAMVEAHLEGLVKRSYPDAEAAMDRFDEFRSDMGIE